MPPSDAGQAMTLSDEDASALLVRKDGWYEAEAWWFSLSGLCQAYSFALGLVGDMRGKTVLDCGCGGGHTSVMLAKHGAKVTAFDLSEDVLVKARLLARANGVEINFVQSSFEELDFPDDSFDVVFGSLILHHVDVGIVGRHLRRILRPNGKAVFVENSARNPFLMFTRKYLVGRFGIPKFGDDKEHPFRLSDIDTLGASFGTTPRVYFTHLLLFRLLDVYILQKRVAAITWLLRVADETFGRWHLLRRYSYLQVVELPNSSTFESAQAEETIAHD